jgi:hypothetical protein
VTVQRETPLPKRQRQKIAGEQACNHWEPSHADGLKPDIRKRLDRLRS